jgi:hypothetical protein
VNYATSRRLLWLVSALFAVALGARAATTEQEVEEDQSLATKLVTPHRPWARGYVGGAPRALFFVNPGAYTGEWFAPETRLREVVELAQRVDLEADAIFFGGSKGDEFFGLELGRRRAERLLAQPYQVYVFANARFEKLPPQFQFLIMEQVAKGAGLVCCGPTATEFMTAKRRLPAPVPWLMDGLPELDGKAPTDVLSAYRLGAGRGVRLGYEPWALTPKSEFSYAAVAEYDYRLLWVARCVLWAAGREGAVSVAFRARAEGGPVPPPPAWVVEIARTATAPSRLQVDINVRRRSDGWILALEEESLSLEVERPGAVPVALPRLRAGAYVIDAIVRSRRGVEAFAATAFEVTSPFGVEAVRLDQSFAERGDTLTGCAVLRGPVPAGSQLRLCFRDSFDRVLEQRDLLAPLEENAKLPFKYQPGPHDTILMRCQAVLRFEGREVDAGEGSFYVPERRRGQFNFLQWDTPTDVLAGYAWQQMRQAGMNLCLVGSFGQAKAIPALAASDIALVPYTTRILDPKDPNGVMQVRGENGNNTTLCWNDAPAIDQYVRRIVDRQAKHREHGVFCYSLGDEGVTQGCCVHPACIQAYRGYLQAQYGTIERLNASWNATYAAFTEVALLDPKDNMETAARDKGLYARWYDRQAFSRWNLMQFSGRFVKAFRDLDPQALTGFEGTGGFGDDFDTILGINTFYSPYPGLGDDIILAAAPRALIRANWMGYSKTADALTDAAWRMVMRNMDSVWYWMWTGIGSWRGYVTPTLDFYPATAELTAEMTPVRRGLGDLLLQAQPVHSGIAVFYSLPSALAHGLDGSAGYVGAEATHQAWLRLTSELGLDARYLTQAMLRQGALRPSEFRLLLLPLTQAVAADEAELIRAFVEAGGTVIADVRPGVFDGHCKPTTPGSLEALFGIRRSGRGAPLIKPLDLKLQFGGKELLLQTPASRLDPGIEVAGAQALGQVDGTPVMLINTVGRGRAILLNFQVLSDKADEAQYAAARRFVRSLYALAQVTAPVTAAAPDGEALPLTETRVWRTGDALVFGLWRQMQCDWFSPTAGTLAGAPQPARITLPTPRYVYDLRQGKYLGHTAEIETSLRWGRANFFLAVPERLGAVEVQLSSPQPSPGALLQAQVTLAGAGQGGARQAVYAEVIDPDGNPAAWGGRTLILENGHGRMSVPVAYNAEPGRWRLRVTELFSHASTEATWRVR